MSRQGRVRPILAGIYLLDALQAVRNAGSADTLYDADIREDRSGIEREWVPQLAAQRRAGYSRTALGLAAFSAEAYINEFLEARVTERDFEALDRLSTPEKYVLGARLVLGKDLFRRDRNPLQSLRTLFTIRNRLAHPKGLQVGRAGSTDRADFVLSPETAMRHIVHVATAANSVITEGGRRRMDQHAGVVIAGE